MGRIYAFDDQGKYLWNFQAGYSYIEIAIGIDGTIYAIVEPVNIIYALDGVTGNKKWEFMAAAYPRGTPAVSEKLQTLFFGGNSIRRREGGGQTTDLSTYALNINNGHKRWKYIVDKNRSSFFCVKAINFDNTVYFGDASRTVAMNGESGEKLWSVTMKNPLISSDGNLLFFSNGTATNSKTGEEIWENNEATGTRVVLNNGSILSIKNGSISCFSQLTGIRHWEQVTDKSINFSLPVITNDGTLYFLGSDKTIYSILTNSSGELVSPWPMVGQNSQRTSRQPLSGDQQRGLASPVTYKGELIDIEINYPGKGYTIPPKVDITGGGGNGAMAKAFVSGGIVTDIIILNPGQGYTSAPSIEIDWPLFPPKQAFATPQITNGFLTGFNIEDPGSGYINLPTIRIVSDEGNGAVAEAVLVRSKLIEIKVINPGSGYDEKTEIKIDPPPYPPSRAAAVATIVNGFIINLEITNEGLKYKSPPSVSIVGEGGIGAEATAVIKDGMVIELELKNAGSGYPENTEVVIAPPIDLEPSFVTGNLSIYPAVELEFPTLESKTYQLQWSTDLINWNDDEQPFSGIGGMTSIFKSVEKDGVYWRLKIYN